MLELQSVTVAVGGEEGPTLLAEISARFRRGELCALIGPSGSGKTTLIRAVAGMAEPTAGSLRWANHFSTPISSTAEAKDSLNVVSPGT